MSVTVANILTLPSMRGARVLGGRGGLNKIISSISVLESTDPAALIDSIFPNDEFFGSEIVITGFLNIQNDVDRQYANMLRLAEGGEVGLILFYVGVYMPRVDQRLIDLADEKDFVLISMPEGLPMLRYSEVLGDVTECIYRDRMRNESVVSEILARVSRLPAHQRTVDTVLKMLSDRISASVALTDSAHRVLNLIAWPRSIEPAVKAGLTELEALPPPEEAVPCGFLPGGWMHRCLLEKDSEDSMELFLMKEGTALDAGLLAQAADVVRLSINIWGENHGDVAVHELVRAILQDEPIKMRRLAEIFHIDVASIHEMWILSGGDCDFPQRLAAISSDIQSAVAGYYETAFFDQYEGQLLLFLATPDSFSETERFSQELLALVEETENAVTITRCNGLKNTTDVRRAYLTHQEYLADTQAVFPLKRNFSLGDLEFARSCRSLVEQGEEVLRRCTALLEPLKCEHEDLTDTLSVYLLDCESSVTQTAQRLYLHKNTIKYRLRRIADILGCRPDKMPESMKLYQAAAVRRLVRV